MTNEKIDEYKKIAMDHLAGVITNPTVGETVKTKAADTLLGNCYYEPTPLDSSYVLGQAAGELRGSDS